MVPMQIRFGPPVNGQDVEYVMNAGLESTLADVTEVYITMRSVPGYAYYDATPLISIP